MGVMRLAGQAAEQKQVAETRAAALLLLLATSQPAFPGRLSRTPCSGPAVVQQAAAALAFRRRHGQ